ncbi:hypothetical protein HQ346_17910 [Rhodococcus sp. BP-252]|nr:MULTISPECIES: hypothetical protein [unclassified Rhodococcus (in: high G+C Gram-positive bacteria)]MBY6486389.1 hypothetical protein [Rhodococcus sp. BP-265]MBY6573318.1 hypothetical protein [Rhodococcus sp. BP-253]MBY6413537.1 hypothetical protein [Rhodococcus sp. BP-320]MBY6418267.1 hypothetical protein [Rhodococcus sp. BP-321]MBY6422681.1 hypothetical protein [Rhodococcus sp. BP-324]
MCSSPARPARDRQSHDKRIDKAAPADAVAGDRYAEAQMAQLDSEA